MDDCLSLVFERFDHPFLLLRCREVCKKWKTLADGSMAWGRILKSVRTFGGDPLTKHLRDCTEDDWRNPFRVATILKDEFCNQVDNCHCLCQICLNATTPFVFSVCTHEYLRHSVKSLCEACHEQFEYNGELGRILDDEGIRDAVIERFATLGWIQPHACDSSLDWHGLTAMNRRYIKLEKLLSPYNIAIRDDSKFSWDHIIYGDRKCTAEFAATSAREMHWFFSYTSYDTDRWSERKICTCCEYYDKYDKVDRRRKRLRRFTSADASPDLSEGHYGVQTVKRVNTDMGKEIAMQKWIQARKDSGIYHGPKNDPVGDERPPETLWDWIGKLMRGEAKYKWAPPKTN